MHCSMKMNRAWCLGIGQSIKTQERNGEMMNMVKGNVCDMSQSSGSSNVESGQDSTFMWILGVIVTIMLITSKLWNVQ